MAKVGSVCCNCCQYFHLSRFQILQAASHTWWQMGEKTDWSIVLTLLPVWWIAGYLNPISNERLSFSLIQACISRVLCFEKPSTADQLSISDWCPSSNIKLCWHSLDVWRNHPIGGPKKNFSWNSLCFTVFQQSCHQSCCASPHLPIPSQICPPATIFSLSDPFKGTIFLFQAVTQQTKEGHITSVDSPMVHLRIPLNHPGCLRSRGLNPGCLRSRGPCNMK